MNGPARYYRENATYIEHADRRLDAITGIVAGLSPARVLDVGCGTGFLAAQLRSGLDGGAPEVVGLDVLAEVRRPGMRYVVADMTRGLPFRSGSFDCAIAGEVLEHVVDPDHLLAELHRVLSPGGHLVLSTPNIVSWANRLLVPFGIQPLATETSSQVALGRRWRALGQGNQVQGHLKVFSHRALGEILARQGFHVTERRGMPAEFPFPLSLVDRFFTRVVPLASDLLYVATALSHPSAPPPPRPLDPRGRRR